jgi:putative DNA primase/helicase
MNRVDDFEGPGPDMEDYWGENVVPLHGGLPFAITIEAGRLHTNASDAERALINAGAPLYVRAEKLMRPVVDDLPASHGRRAKAARLTQVSEAAMIDYLSRAAKFQKWDARAKRYATINPPTQVAQIILSRDGEWPFRRLSGVITTPTIRPDGSILRDPGYDEATQLLLLDPPEMPRLPAKPSKAVAEKALKKLDSLLDEFPFTDEASRSVALSALITPVVRGALSVAPMHVTRAPVAGSGKSYIIDLASALNSGERAPVITAGRTEEETEKRLVAALLTGQTIISIDNVNGELGGDALCQIIERPVVSVRPLGQSSFIKIESRATCFATGNNIRLVGDMTRRVIICSLDPDMERPELREFKRDPFDDVLANRGLYVAAALTIVSAYMQAGCPDQVRPIASFEDWSRIVRSALIWLGRADPVETMNAAREDDPVKLTLLNLLSAWHEAAGTVPHTTTEIVSLSQQLSFDGSNLNENLREAVSEIAFDRAKGINSTKLGYYLRAHADRIVNGLKVTNVGKDRTNKVLWKVVKS